MEIISQVRGKKHRNGLCYFEYY